MLTLVSLDISTNPNDILADFNSKMQNIQNLEQSYIQNANQFAQNTGRQIGNAINNKDFTGAVSGAIGFFSQMSAQKQTRKTKSESP